MKLGNLKDLYRFLKKEGIDRYKFNFSFNGVVFETLYFIDDEPHSLSMGVRNHNFYFEVPVKHGFIINTVLDRKTYSELFKVLGLTYDENNPFSPDAFFTSFNSQIPSQFKKTNIPLPHEVFHHRSDVEESKKIYFIGWRDNKKVGKQVRPENLEKTRKLLSLKAYEMCKAKNVSSCWGPNIKDYKEPDLNKI